MNRVNKYFFSSFLTTFASLFATLFLIMSIVFFIQIARITSYIEISFGELIKLYVFMLPQILLFTIPISFFVSVAMSFFRLSKENESTVIFTLGQNPKNIANFFLSVSFILSAIMLINSLVVMPIAEHLNDRFIEYKKTKLSLNIKPSEFGQKFGDWMVFIEAQNDNNQTAKYENIVMYNISDEGEKLITSLSADIINNNSNLELLLGSGKMYTIAPNLWHISNYDSMTIRTLMQGGKDDEYSLKDYWAQSLKSDKRAKDLSIYVLVALFPLASVLFAMSFGIVTYRYEKGIIYFGIFGILFVYFALIMVFAKQPFYAIPAIFALTFIGSLIAFKKKVLNKY
ncbi:putative lipooligosaccharide transport system, permease component (LptF family) [Campylobacter iguaniorum]|uniref:LptF/LptG family permease n=1 Tax=Campylobacter iguaniorum TaxID=1244531 RepID=UPI0007C89D9D|nr:LptF/LptG family permease [Campylobacter iguaniorum]ANE35803.1 putative lipooligosaccharide transport system, permease component (LptF family) [Campylobacter iguaniorum]